MSLPVSRAPLRRFLADAGPLRLALFAFLLLTFVLAPRPGTVPVDHGLAIIPTLLVPISIPVVWVTLLLDALMTRIMMLEHEAGPERTRMRRITWINLILAVIIVVFWIPYFRAI